jgi:AGZA family xanthine/uracil permease-like MFS transporter
MRDFGKDVVVSIILFASACYILILNPVILGKAGFPPGDVFEATAIAAGIGSIFIGFASRAPSIVAPGMGLNAYIAGFTLHEKLSWNFVSWVLFAEVLVCMVVISLWRTKLLEKLPEKVTQIVAASIGGIIFSDAFTVGNLLPNTGSMHSTTSFMSIIADPTIPANAIFLSCTTLTLIVFYFFFHNAHNAEKAGKFDSATAFEFLAALSLLLSIPVTYFLVRKFLGGVDASSITFMNSIGFHTIFSPASIPENFWSAAVVLFLTIMFVQITDISGTPYFLLRDQNLPAEEYEKRSTLGFIGETAASLISVALRGSPAICYAESNIAKNLRAIRGTPAVLCGLLFLLVAVGALFWGGLIRPILQGFPTLSLSPLLACLGIVISANAFSNRPQNVSNGPLDQLQNYVPSIFAIGGAIFRGLTVGIALGIIVEFLFVAARRRSGWDNPIFAVVVLLAFIYLGSVFTEAIPVPK